MNGMANAIGMVELTSIARGIETSDFMVKAAQVELNRVSRQVYHHHCGRYRRC